MESQAPGFEQRLSDLEAQIDRLNVALQHWRDAQDHLQPMERRLAQLTDQCADVLKQWTTTGERHAHAVGELEARLTGWNDVEARLHRDASFRFEALERVIEQEWASLRHVHEEPARQLRTHAENLTEICVATAGSAQTGLERAEARLATLERELHRRMDELSRDMHTALAELRHRGDGSAGRGPASPWSLDEVTRLHQELRENSTPRAALTAGSEPALSGVEGPVLSGVEGPVLSRVEEAAVADAETKSPAQRRASPLFGTIPEAGRTEPIAESASTVKDGSDAVEAAPSHRGDWKWLAAAAVLALAFGVSVAFTMSFYRQAGTAAARASAAQQHAEEIATTASERIEAARQDAATRIAQARETASKAQVTSDVLAAPDLVRFNLTGGEGGARFSAQLLWSRSRGMVFSASRLPAPPPGSTYQIWLLTAANPVSAGTFVPDDSGRVTAATDTPPNVPRPITGVRVTLEPEPGRPEPSGTIVLTRAQ
jgi:Anti-sigma-K factor rskA